MSAPRQNEHIRDLCAKAVTAKDDELNAVLSELRTALQEHKNNLRKMIAKYPVPSDQLLRK